MAIQVRPPESLMPRASRPSTGARGQLLVQSPQGMQRIPWHTEHPAEVAAARRAFTELRHGGYHAYRLGKGSQVHEEVKSFDPEAEEIVMLVPLQGGAT